MPLVDWAIESIVNFLQRSRAQGKMKDVINDKMECPPCASATAAAAALAPAEKNWAGSLKVIKS